MSQAEEKKEHPWLEPLIEFAVHIFVGTAIFLLIGVPAVGLDLLLKVLHNSGINDIIMKGLTAAKIILFVADLLLFLVFVANTSWRFIKTLDWKAKV